MDDLGPQFSVKIATNEAEIRAAQALRYEVFVRELGGCGTLVDHDAGLEQDQFDRYYDHMLLSDDSTGDVVGAYRLLRDDQASVAGKYYSEDEYDLSVLKSSGRRLLELGRSCVRADYRGGTAMYHLWSGLADYVQDHGIDILFGVASFHGTDAITMAQPLSMLHHNHLAPADLRVTARSAQYQNMDLLAQDALDRRSAMLQTPALIKAYLRLGGFVGEGAWIDHDFNTTDVCLVMDTNRMNQRQRRIYTGGRDR
ncbi:MAG: GNAT family N-acetyltransferase [Rhodobacteraceae bacterium]|nr:GNAT family N-acetyltransferase [Paracoccaceae bacterium]